MPSRRFWFEKWISTLSKYIFNVRFILFLLLFAFLFFSFFFSLFHLASPTEESTKKCQTSWPVFSDNLVCLPTLWYSIFSRGSYDESVRGPTLQTFIRERSSLSYYRQISPAALRLTISLGIFLFFFFFFLFPVFFRTFINRELKKEKN